MKKHCNDLALVAAAVVVLSILCPCAHAQAPGWQAPSINHRGSSGPRYWDPQYQYQPTPPQYGNPGHPLYYNPGVLVPPGVDLNKLDYYNRPDTERSRKQVAEGVDLIGKGQYRDAEQVLFAAYCNDQHNGYAINDLGVSLDKQHDTRHALYYYKAAFTTNPHIAWAYFNYAYDGVNIVGSLTAIPYFYQALKLDPTHPWWWYWTANNLAITGQNKYALYCYGKAVKLNGSFADAYHWKGMLELRMHDDADAHPDLQKAIAINPSLGPTITAGVKSIMAARRLAEEERAAEARAAREAQQEEANARAAYQKNGREVAAVVAQGPSYYKDVYIEARNQGDSADEAAQKEAAARQKYDKDVALQNAWEAGDSETVNKINAGEMDSTAIASYDSSSSPTAAANVDDGSSSNSGGEESTPEPTSEPESAPEPESGGDD